MKGYSTYKYELINNNNLVHVQYLVKEFNERKHQKKEEDMDSKETSNGFSWIM